MVFYHCLQPLSKEGSVAFRPGFDLGDVVIDVKGWSQLVPETPFRYAAPVPDALEYVGKMVQKAGPENASVISKVKDNTETLEWLYEQEFYLKTGMLAHTIHFCRNHVDKAAIAAQLGVTHFFDNRLEVLEPMIGVVPHLYLFGATEAPDGIRPISTWRGTPLELL